MRRLSEVLCLLFVSTFVLSSQLTQLNAASLGPQLSVDCGTLEFLEDEEGSFKRFDPEVTVTYTGKKLNYWVYHTNKRPDSFPVNNSQSSQTVKIPKQIIVRTFGVFRSKLDSICVFAQDQYYNKSKPNCAVSVPNYEVGLPVPNITVTPSK